MIDKDTSLTDVAFAISTALDKKSLRVVSVGESAATYYSADGYRSDAIDFVAAFAADRQSAAALVTPTDCVRDRLAHFYAWSDRSALSVAIVVARAQSSSIDVDEIRRWSARENELEKFDEFHRVLTSASAP